MRTNSMLRPSPVPWLALGLGLVVAALAWPAGGRAEAGPPQPAVDSLVISWTAPFNGDGCLVAFEATWDDVELRGPNVNSRLYDVTDGGVLVAGEFRGENDGAATLVAVAPAEGPREYLFALVRGGQERVLASLTADFDISCTDPAE